MSRMSRKLSRIDKGAAFLKSLVIFLCIFYAVETFGNDVKTYGPNCYTETTILMEDDEVIHKEMVQICEEETQQGGQKIDPETKEKITDATILLVLTALFSKLY